MSKSDNTNKIVKSLTNIIMYLLFAALILGLLSGVYYLLTSPSGLYVVYGEENITSDNNGITIEWSAEESEATFTIKNSADWGAYSVQDCTVKIVPNITSDDKDFEFTVSGESSSRLYSLKTDLTAAFVEDYTSYSGNGLEISEDGEFSLYLLPLNSYNLSTAMTGFLSRAYGGSDVTLGSGVDILSYCYFAIKITSPDGTTSYTIPFLLYANEQVYSITLADNSDLEHFSIEPYSICGNLLGYILPGESLTITLTADDDYMLWYIQVYNATVYESGVEYSDGYIFCGGVYSCTFTIANPTDDVISIFAVVDIDL